MNPNAGQQVQLGMNLETPFMMEVLAILFQSCVTDPDVQKEAMDRLTGDLIDHVRRTLDNAKQNPRMSTMVLDGTLGKMAKMAELQIRAMANGLCGRELYSMNIEETPSICCDDGDCDDSSGKSSIIATG